MSHAETWGKSVEGTAQQGQGPRGGSRLGVGVTQEASTAGGGPEVREAER